MERVIAVLEFSWFNSAGLPHTVVPLALVCSVLGALVLYPFTRLVGIWTVPVNFAALFIGAYGANLLLSAVYLPLNRYFERPLILSVLGMTVMSIPLLRMLQRRGNE